MKRQPLQPVMESIVQQSASTASCTERPIPTRPDSDERIVRLDDAAPRMGDPLRRARLHRVDPRVSRIYNRNVPFVWDAAEFRSDPMCRDFLDDAARVRRRQRRRVSRSATRITARVLVAVNSGITPVDEERARARSQAARRNLLLRDVVPRLLHGASGRLRAGADGRVAPLSPREEQCLQLAANGMTSVDIAASSASVDAPSISISPTS